MNYFQFHIGDYKSATSHLSNEEDLAYRRLLDMYYDTESAIPLDTQWVARRIRVGIDVVDLVLKDMFLHTENGWTHSRCDELIADYHAMLEKNRANGRKGGRKKNPVGFQVVTDSQPIAKATINQEPRTSIGKASRLPTDFQIPVDWKQWARTERSDLDVEMEADSFKDYWSSKGGKEACKTDWYATWRNWVRRANAPKAGQKTVSNIMAGVR
jgi:uncharacterized protein YdaU (DUF1376 family)